MTGSAARTAEWSDRLDRLEAHLATQTEPTIEENPNA